jgi:hypothetical protein
MGFEIPTVAPVPEERSPKGKGELAEFIKKLNDDEGVIEKRIKFGRYFGEKEREGIERNIAFYSKKSEESKNIKTKKEAEMEVEKLRIFIEAMDGVNRELDKKRPKEVS